MQQQTSLAHELRTLIKLSLPLVVVQLGYVTVGLVDTVLAGRVSAEAQGATGMGAGIFFAIGVFGMGVILGLDPLLSQTLGAGRLDAARSARAIMWQGFYVASSLVIPIMLVVVALAFCLEMFGIEPGLAAMTRQYMWGRLPAMLPFLLGQVPRSWLQAHKDTSTVMWSMLIGNVVNFVAAWLLLFGNVTLGIPSLGVFGLGLACSIGTLAQALFLGIAVARLPSTADEKNAARVFQPALVRRLLRIGWPIGLQLLAEVTVFSLVGLIMGTLGAVTVAAHQVALMLATCSFAVCMGFSTATAVQVGWAVGAGDAALTRLRGMAGASIALVFMSITALSMWFLPHFWVSLVTRDAAVIHLAAQLLKFAAVFQLADGVQAVMSGCMRGAGSTRWAFAANLVGHWFVGLPLGLLLAFGMHMGPAGLWIGLSAGLMVVAGALTWKFLNLCARPIAAVEGVYGEM